MSPGFIISITMVVHIPFAHSLKDKRRHIKSLKDKILQRFNASVAEIDNLNEWQKSVVGIVMISNDRNYLEQQLRAIETLTLQIQNIQLIDIHVEWL